MKAPDKIYLVETTRIIDEWRRKPSQYAKNIEYIRKEALLEWANGMMDCFAPGGDCSQTLQMVIKHIESL